MPQTNPFHSLVPRKMTDKELARAIRLDMESEFDAINLYSAHIEATDNEEAKAILAHVMDEEKEHAALFWQLIHRLDPEQAEHARDEETILDLADRAMYRGKRGTRNIIYMAARDLEATPAARHSLPTG